MMSRMGKPRPEVVVLGGLLGSVSVGLIGCADDGILPPDDDSKLHRAPAIPLFVSPTAAGDTFPLTNFFDHEYPRQFGDDNGYQLTWFDGHYDNIDGHSGYDWLMPVGTPLMSVAAGRVEFVGVSSPFYCPPLDRTVSDQLLVQIRHTVPGADDVSSIYLHLDDALVEVGDDVTQGQLIGLSGNSGCSTDPHLHFHTWRHVETSSGSPVAIDPYGWSAVGRDDPWALDLEGARSINLWSEPPPLCTDTRCYPNSYEALDGPNG